MILVSTNGLTISQHFCAGELMTSAIFVKAKKCKNHKEVVELTCCQKRALEKNLKSCQLEKDNGCCDEKTTFLQVDEEGQTLFVDFQQILPVFIAIIPIQNLQFQKILPYSIPKYFNYKPPLIIEDDIEVLVESFLC